MTRTWRPWLRWPTPAVLGVVRRRIVDLCQWLHEEFKVSVAKQTLGLCRARNVLRIHEWRIALLSQAALIIADVASRWRRGAFQ
jgi:hypothetical protein